MNLGLVINDRPAIPVRAVPFVTGWIVSPDILVSSLARREEPGDLIGLTGFHLSADGVAKMLPKEWDPFEIELELLSKQLNSCERAEVANTETWHHQSILRLPAACFVWQDEFERAFREAYSSERFTFINEREGERELNYSPFVPGPLVGYVTAGFEGTGSSRSSDRCGPNLDRATPLLQVVLDAFEYWNQPDRPYPDKKTSEVQDWIKERMSQHRLPTSKTLIDHIETIIAPRIYSHTRQRGHARNSAKLKS